MMSSLRYNPLFHENIQYKFWRLNAKYLELAINHCTCKYEKNLGKKRHEKNSAEAVRGKNIENLAHFQLFCPNFGLSNYRIFLGLKNLYIWGRKLILCACARA